MKDITLFFDLIFIGGIETCFNDMFYTFKNSKEFNLSLAHIYQYYTQQESVIQLSKNAKKVIDIGTSNELNTDIFVSATMIFPYDEILNKVKAKHKIGWLHAIPDKQCTYENIFKHR